MTPSPTGFSCMLANGCPKQRHGAIRRATGMSCANVDEGTEIELAGAPPAGGVRRINRWAIYYNHGT